MFQGSANVARGEHIAIVNAAGGTMNGTTWCDRTNYFETMPSHHLATALWLEADRMGGLLEVLDQDNLDNQREVVKNEKRQTRDNQPYGSWLDHIHAMCFPTGHPYHHTTIGSMADLDAASLEDARNFYSTSTRPGTHPTTRCSQSSVTSTRLRHSSWSSGSSERSHPRAAFRRHRPRRSHRDSTASNG
jgi:predicted Zn-dependent peptidase